MSEIKVNNIQSLSGTNGPEISGTVEMNSTGTMSLPRGNTAYRGGRGRGLFGGGYGASSPYPEQQVIDYVTISTLGNSHDFGDLSVARSAKSGGSSSTRGLFIGGRFSPTASFYNVIDYITISSTGNAFDFGDLTLTNNPSPNGTSNQIRTVYGGGYKDGVSNIWLGEMGYFAIATKGNSSYFGELAVKGRRAHSGSNGTRGIWGSTRGGTPGSTNIWINSIEYVNIMTTGNGIDFGDMTVARSNSAGSMTSSTRMVMQGGVTPSYNNTIDYITMASTGDAIDFGDTGSGAEASASTTNTTRGVFHPGTPGGGNTLEYITIATTGNSQDFGDLNTGRRVYGTVSDAHGGLS